MGWLVATAVGVGKSLLIFHSAQHEDQVYFRVKPYVGSDGIALIPPFFETLGALLVSWVLC